MSPQSATKRNAFGHELLMIVVPICCVVVGQTPAQILIWAGVSLAYLIGCYCYRRLRFVAEFQARKEEVKNSHVLDSYQTLSDAFDVKVGTLRDWVRRGWITPFFRSGSTVRFKRDEVIAQIRRCRHLNK